jgi:hypothetical protein
MADYDKVLRANNWKLPEPEPEPEDAQEAVPPAVDVDIVWNVYSEKGDAKSMALRISLRLPLMKS